jgi:hypothetical protein
MDESNIIRELKAGEQLRQPIRRSRRGVLSQEGNIVTAGFTHQEVARPTVGEARRRNFDYARAERAGEVNRPVARPRIANKKFELAIKLLRADGVQDLGQQDAAVKYRNRDRDN